MRREELKAVFDQQAAGYEKQWARMAPIRDGLHFLLESIFADLPADARMLCVGAGTGAELAYLARTFPRWRFTAVDPSGAMLDVMPPAGQNRGVYTRVATFMKDTLTHFPPQTCMMGPHVFWCPSLSWCKQLTPSSFAQWQAGCGQALFLASADLALRRWCQCLRCTAPCLAQHDGASGHPTRRAERLNACGLCQRRGDTAAQTHRSHH